MRPIASLIIETEMLDTADWTEVGDLPNSASSFFVQNTADVPIKLGVDDGKGGVAEIPLVVAAGALIGGAEESPGRPLATVTPIVRKDFHKGRKVYARSAGETAASEGGAILNLLG